MHGRWRMPPSPTAGTTLRVNAILAALYAQTLYKGIRHGCRASPPPTRTWAPSTAAPTPTSSPAAVVPVDRRMIPEEDPGRWRPTSAAIANAAATFNQGRSDGAASTLTSNACCRLVRALLLPGNQPLVVVLQRWRGCLVSLSSPAASLPYTDAPVWRSRYPWRIHGAGPRTVLESSRQARADERI